MELKNPMKEVQADIDAVNRIPIISSLLEVVCKTTGMGFAAVARVTESKWVTCATKDDILFGLQPGDELVLESTICNEIRQHHQPVIIDHVDKDEHFRIHHTPLQYGFQSYISMPIMRKDGSFFGTLCAIDPKPANLNNATVISMFRMFAELIAFHLDTADELALSQAKLLEEQKTAELREQFIAILGHDLRNPLGAVMMGSDMLIHFPLDEESLQIAKTIKNSSYRMSVLIDNMLDFARGTMGGGISLNKQSHNLKETFNQVIAELHTIWPERTIETDFRLTQPFYCDANRLAQLFSNLLGNAFIHGKAGTPVKIAASSDDGLILSISNEGQKIPDAALDQLFKPFYRGEDKSGKKGLGLGLYIAAEITKAHGGELTVQSTEAATCFTVKIPG